MDIENSYKLFEGDTETKEKRHNRTMRALFEYLKCSLVNNIEDCLEKWKSPDMYSNIGVPLTFRELGSQTVNAVWLDVVGAVQVDLEAGSHNHLSLVKRETSFNDVLGFSIVEKN